MENSYTIKLVVDDELVDMAQVDYFLFHTLTFHGWVTTVDGAFACMLNSNMDHSELCYRHCHDHHRCTMVDADRLDNGGALDANTRRDVVGVVLLLNGVG